MAVHGSNGIVADCSRNVTESPFREGKCDTTYLASLLIGYGHRSVPGHVLDVQDRTDLTGMVEA
jgi:hypothetical protein